MSRKTTSYNARVGRGRVGRGGGQGTRRVVLNEISATVIDHVIKHGLLYNERGWAESPAKFE